MTLPHIIGPTDGETLELGGFGVRYLAEGAGLSVVEHPIAPRTLAAPLHTHAHEDEYSYVLEGEVGVQIGEQILYARPGDLVVKPRGVPHAFWNRADAPARLLEIISPGGFAGYFREIAPLLPPRRPGPDLAGLGAIMARYGLTMDLDSIPAICQREGIPLPPA